MQLLFIFSGVVFLLVRIFVLTKMLRHGRGVFADEQVHLAIERLFVKEKGNESFRQVFPLEGRRDFGYPHLYQVAVGRLFSSIVAKRCLSMFFQAMTAVIWAVIGADIFSHLAWYGVAALLVSSCTTLVMLEFYTTYTERGFADFLVATYFLALVHHILSASWLSLAAAVITLLIILLSTQFGIQAIIFISLALSMISGNVVPLWLLLMGLLAAVLIDKQRVKRILSYMHAHSHWYSRNLSFLFDSRVKVLSIKAPIFNYLMIYMPFFPLYLLAGLYLHGISGDTVSSLVLACFAVGIITATPQICFLGPGFRYSSFAIPYIYVLMAGKHPEMTGYLLLVEGCFSVIYVFVFYYLKGRTEKKQDDIGQLQSLLQEIDRSPHVVCISPIKLAYVLYALGSKNLIYKPSFLSLPDDPYFLRVIESIMPKYPKIVDDIRLLEFIRAENVTAFIYDKRMNSPEKSVLDHAVGFFETEDYGLLYFASQNMPVGENCHV